MKKSAFLGSILSFLVIAFLTAEATPTTEGGREQPQLYGEEALKKMKVSDLKDGDIVEIKGKRMTAGQFKVRVRRELRIGNPTNPLEVAQGLNYLYGEPRFELKPTYDEAELKRMMEDLMELVSRDRAIKPKTKPPDLTGSDLGKPIPPPVAQKPQKFPEPIRPDRPKRPESQSRDDEEFIDLRSRIMSLQKDGKLKEGDNLIHTTPSGLRFTARVEGGRIIGWVITDKLGREVNPADNVCWSCREVEGETQCYMLPCPKR